MTKSRRANILAWHSVTYLPWCGDGRMASRLQPVLRRWKPRQTAKTPPGSGNVLPTKTNVYTVINEPTWPCNCDSAGVRRTKWVRIPCELVWSSGKAILGQTSDWVRFCCPFSSTLWFMDTAWSWLCLSTINETLKWLTPLPIFMQNHSGSDSVVLGIYSFSPPPSTS